MTDAAPRPARLHGRAFYESIGSPKFVLAPMVDQSEFARRPQGFSCQLLTNMLQAWRMLSRSFMTPESSKSLLAYTPMLHARMFGETPKFRDGHFQPTKDGLTEKPSAASTQRQPWLDGNPSIDRPLFVQFCANNPDELLSAAEYVAPYCDAVDLNLGCPQGIARRGKYGAFLQEDQDLIYKLINKLHTNLSVPITAKIRILETREQTLEYARKVLSAGASVLTVHGRQRDQKGHKTGLADWNVLRYLRDQLPKETVIFANGNVLQRDDIDRCLKLTGADAVMSAEGNLCDPTIFSEPPPIGEEGREYWRGNDGKGGYRMDAVLRRYLDIIYQYVLEVPKPARRPLFVPSDPPAEVSFNLHDEPTAEEEGEEPPRKKRKEMKKEKTTNPNLLAMQAHLFHLLRSLVKKHHDIRDALAKCRAGDVAAFEDVLQMVERVVRDGIMQYEASDGKSIEEDFITDQRLPGADQTPLLEGSSPFDASTEAVATCRRAWWVCQPYVRPLPAEALQKGSLTLSKKELAQMSREETEKLGAQVKTELAAMTAPVDTIAGTKREEVDGSKEMVEIPKEGLVCG